MLFLKSKRKKSFFISIIFLTIAIMLIVYITFFNLPLNRMKRELSLGDRYLSELNYDQAIIAYETVIEIDPMNVEAYLGLIEAYKGKMNYEVALEVSQRGYELTRDGRLQQENITIEEIKSMDFNSNKGSIYEKEGDYKQKLEKLALLFDEGRTNDMFQFEELTFFGHPIEDISKEIFKSLLIENEYVLITDEPDKCSANWFPGGWAKDAPSIWASGNIEDETFNFWSFTNVYYCESAEHMPIGVRDAYTHDALEDVLSAVGFSNGVEISNCINELFARNGYSTKFYHNRGADVFEVSLADNENPRIWFSFTNHNYSGIPSTDFDFVNGHLWKKSQNENENLENTFDDFCINFSYPEGTIFFRFTQYEGSFVRLDDFEVLLNN